MTQIKELKPKHKCFMKTSEENTGESLLAYVLGNDFLSVTPKAQ